MRSKRRKIWVYATFAILGLAVVCIAPLLWWFSPAWTQIQSFPVTDKEKFDASLEVAKVVITAVGTIATIAGGVALYLNFWVANKQARIANRQAELVESRLITERFSKAVEQLGAEDGKVAVRLGGIYALERIALDSPRDYWTVIEVLTAFVRDKARLQQPDQKPVYVRDLEEEYMEQQLLEHEFPYGYDEYVQAQGKMITRTPNWNYIHPIAVEVQAVLTALGRRPSTQGFEQYILDLSRTDLRGLLLTGNLEGIKFEEADLRYSILQEVTLNRSNLVKSKLEQVRFKNVNLRNVDLQGAHLQWARFTDTRFEAVNLEDAYLSETKFHGVDLTQVNLKNASLREAEFTESTLRQAILKEASLSQAVLNGINLEDADLEGANLDGAFLSYASLSSANLEAASLDRAILSNGNLDNANLEYADSKGANLDNATLRKANLKSASFRDATLKQADLSQADLTEAKLQRVDLTEASFKDSNLSMAKIYGSNLSSVKLTGANCRKAEFRRSAFVKTDLSGADLTHTNFTGAMHLTPEQVKSAFNWDKAVYDEDLREQLGLPPHYDAEIRNELGLPAREA